MTAWTMETAFSLPFRSEEKTMQQKNISLYAIRSVSALIVAIACGILLLVRKSEMTAGVLGVETMICLLIVLLLADLLVPLQIKFRGRKIKDRDSGNGWYSGSGL